jgi:DNA primase
VYRVHAEKAPGYFYWLADRARGKFDMRTSEGRVAGLKFLLPAVQRISDKLERATVANDLANYLGIETGLVLEHFRKAAAERREKTLSAAVVEVKPVERILFNAVLGSEEIRRSILPRLKRAPQLEQFRTVRIFQALIAMEESGAPFRVADVQARLGEADQDLFATLLFADKGDDEQSTGTDAEACLRELERSGLEARRTALKSRIKEAERAGMLEEALRCAEELGRLERA